MAAMQHMTEHLLARAGAAFALALCMTLPAAAANPDAIEGTYRARHGTLLIRKSAADLFEYCFDVSNGRNFGSMSGRARMRGARADSAPHGFVQCRVSFVFRGNAVEVRQEPPEAPTCGLGFGVTVEGPFRRISSKPPRVTPACATLPR